MNRSWKIQAITACALMVLMFAAVGAQAVAVRVRHPLGGSHQSAAAAPVEGKTPRSAAQWGTVIQTAAMHAGPGLRYPMTGTISTGHGVEVVRVLDGFCKCMTYKSAEPVWICAEYIQMVE